MKLGLLLMMLVAAAPAPAPKKRATECSACHTQRSWTEVTFAHERTGFPLAGAHAKTSCRSCHRVDFTTQLANTCAGCHRDRHAGEFGTHCEGCHTPTDWRVTLFGGEGHRSSAFPLLGRHAAIPCHECHGDMRDRTFLRAPLQCDGCHLADYERAATVSIDHAAAGFSKDCQACHTSWAFSPARFEAHDRCFRIAAGPHAALRCQQCHSRVAGLAATGACGTQTSTCASCHAHNCAKTDAQHTAVMGYACVSQKCAECHQGGIK